MAAAQKRKTGWHPKRNATTLDSERGRKLRRIKGARRAHAAILRSGRQLGEEGRRVIEANRVRRKEEERITIIKELSSVRGPSGQLSPEQESANEMMRQRWEEQKEVRVETLAQEWAAKQRRLTAERPNYDPNRVGRANVDGI